MSLPSGTFTPENPSLFSDDNSNWTQKQKRRRLEVWNHFDKYEDENGKKWAICKICYVKKNGSSKMGTTHLYNHFNSCSKNKKNEGGGSASGDKPAENSNQTQKQKRRRLEVWNHFDKYEDENGKKWAICKICNVKKNGSSKMGTTHLYNHFNSCSQNKSNEGGGSASGDKPAEDSVMDQRLNHLDKSNEGGGSASGDKPAENSVMDQQLNCLDQNMYPSQVSNLSNAIRSGKLTTQQTALVAQKFKMRTGMIGGPQSNLAGMSGPRQQMLPGSAGLSLMLAQNLNRANMNPLQRTTMGPMGPMGPPKLIPGINHNQQLNHLDKSKEGGGSASGDKPAEDSVMDQQSNHLDKSNEGGGSASGDKPAENSVKDQQLNCLDRVKMLIKQSSMFEPLPKSIEAVDIINAYNEEKEKLQPLLKSIEVVDIINVYNEEKEKHRIYFLKENIDATRQRYIEMESANNVLRAQTMELTHRLQSLNSILQMLGEVTGLNVEIPEVPDPLMKPWQPPGPVQPIMASAADMFHY